jgi:hypothetical protein
VAIEADDESDSESDVPVTAARDETGEAATDAAPAPKRARAPRRRTSTRSAPAAAAEDAEKTPSAA